MSAPSYAEEINTVVDPRRRYAIEGLIESMKLRMNTSMDEDDLRPAEALDDALDCMRSMLNHPTSDFNFNEDEMDVVMKHAKYRLVGYLGLVGINR